MYPYTQDQLGWYLQKHLSGLLSLIIQQPDYLALTFETHYKTALFYYWVIELFCYSFSLQLHCSAPLHSIWSSLLDVRFSDEQLVILLAKNLQKFREIKLWAAQSLTPSTVFPRRENSSYQTELQAFNSSYLDFQAYNKESIGFFPSWSDSFSGTQTHCCVSSTWNKWTKNPNSLVKGLWKKIISTGPSWDAFFLCYESWQLFPVKASPLPIL